MKNTPCIAQSMPHKSQVTIRWLTTDVQACCDPCARPASSSCSAIELQLDAKALSRLAAMGGSPERQPPTPAQPDHDGPTMVYMHGVPLPLAALNGWFAEQSAPVEVTVICDEAGGAARAERRAERRAEIEFN